MPRTPPAAAEKPGLGLRLAPGRPLPYGCSEGRAEALNFSLLAPDTESAWLLLEVPAQRPAKGISDPPKLEMPLRLTPSRNRTGPVWHMEVAAPFPAAGLRYAWLLDPTLGDDGRPLQSAPRIIDPCARALDSPGAAAWNRRSEERKYSPFAVVPDFRALRAFNWEGVVSPGLELQDLVIYEAHVRGFTRHPDSGVSRWASSAGTFRGFAEKIPHLLSLGVNCVELLPIFEFDETACPRTNPTTGEHLCNYWGYSTAAFFVPMQRFASSSWPQLSAAVVEFKTLVRELHRYGIEVILDVVFNHTGEGAWGETNWHSLSAIAESHYYLMSKGHHTNYTGCGNTVLANSPVGAEWICECLRYWALEMRVDGFRFDLASCLARGSDGQISPDPLFIRRLANDPCLKHAKLIAEPWDCSWPDGYLVGKFPSCGPPRFAEWNGKFRDAVRGFIKGDPGMKGQFATRLCGSADLYQEDGRGPCHSVNFVTAHDGFTLRDLVSYNTKHNAQNAEESGDDNNMSWNCGVEGPTSDLEVAALRNRQIRNFMVALFVSAGTPMLVSGDEYGRTQEGNNNTWCQDAASWFSWDACAKEEAGLLRFCRLLISLRKRHGGLFARTAFLSDHDIKWNHGDWDDQYNFVSFMLRARPPSSGDADAAAGKDAAPIACPSRPSAADAGSAGSEMGSGASDSGSAGTQNTVPSATVRLLIAFNAGHVTHGCDLPAGHQWHRLIDTNLEAPEDICDCDDDAQVIEGGSYLMTPYSCIVLKSFQDPGDSLTYGDAELGRGLEQVAEELRAVVHREVSQELEDVEDFVEMPLEDDRAVTFRQLAAASVREAPTETAMGA